MNRKNISIFLITLLSVIIVSAQNPIIRDQFSADPTARVFNGKVYLYPSHDIIAPSDQTHLREKWFCMEDYHVFSSENLTDWEDHGMILSQTDVPWANPTAYSMWAPDCIENNGKYYFYFPAKPDSLSGKKWGIGVAIADHPDGPFIPEAKPIEKAEGIDPNVFIDQDEKAYLYWKMNKQIYAAPLKEDMVSLASEPVALVDFPKKGHIEGPFLFERNGIYYMSIPHVENRTERLEYYTASSPTGPFKFGGVIMDESPTRCWTNHQSIVNYKDQWYLFYHHNDYSPQFDKNRSVKIDSLFFNADGTIEKVNPTLRGVGITSAEENIQLDRYSAISENGTSIAFNDTTNTFAGWSAVFDAKGAWIQYNVVDFGKGRFKSVEMKVRSANGGKLQLRLNSLEEPVLAVIDVPKQNGWQTVKFPLSGLKSGVHNLILSSENSHLTKVDWVNFK